MPSVIFRVGLDVHKDSLTATTTAFQGAMPAPLRNGKRLRASPNRGCELPTENEILKLGPLEAFIWMEPPVPVAPLQHPVMRFRIVLKPCEFMGGDLILRSTERVADLAYENRVFNGHCIHE